MSVPPATWKLPLRSCPRVRTGRVLRLCVGTLSADRLRASRLRAAVKPQKRHDAVAHVGSAMQAAARRPGTRALLDSTAVRLSRGGVFARNIKEQTIIFGFDDGVALAHCSFQLWAI